MNILYKMVQLISFHRTFATFGKLDSNLEWRIYSSMWTMSNIIRSIGPIERIDFFEDMV